MSVNVIPNFYNETECQWILNNMIIVSDNQDLKRGHVTMTPYYLNQLANALNLPQDHTVNMDIPIRVTSLEDSEYHKDIILGTEIESKRVAMIYLNTCPDSNIEYKLGKGKVKKIPIEMGKLIIHDGLEHKVNVKDKCTRYILGPIDISGGEHTYTEVGDQIEGYSGLWTEVSPAQFSMARLSSGKRLAIMDKTLLFDKPVNKELNMKLFVVLGVIGLLLYNRKVKVYNITLILLLIYVIYNRNNDQRNIGPDPWTLHAGCSLQEIRGQCVGPFVSTMATSGTG